MDAASAVAFFRSFFLSWIEFTVNMSHSFLCLVAKVADSVKACLRLFQICMKDKLMTFTFCPPPSVSAGLLYLLISSSGLHHGLQFAQGDWGAYDCILTVGLFWPPHGSVRPWGRSIPPSSKSLTSFCSSWASLWSGAPMSNGIKSGEKSKTWPWNELQGRERGCLTPLMCTATFVRGNSGICQLA